MVEGFGAEICVVFTVVWAAVLCLIGLRFAKETLLAPGGGISISFESLIASSTLL